MSDVKTFGILDFRLRKAKFRKLLRVWRAFPVLLLALLALVYLDSKLGLVQGILLLVVERRFSITTETANE